MTVMEIFLCLMSQGEFHSFAVQWRHPWWILKWNLWTLTTTSRLPSKCSLTPRLYTASLTSSPTRRSRPNAASGWCFSSAHWPSSCTSASTGSSSTWNTLTSPSWTRSRRPWWSSPRWRFAISTPSASAGSHATTCTTRGSCWRCWTRGWFSRGAVVKF